MPTGEWTDFSGVAWRVESASYVEQPLSVAHTSRASGRWHRVGQTCLYLNANHPAVVANAQAKIRWPQELPAAEVLRGGESGALVVWEVGVNEPLRCARIKAGTSAVSWGLPGTYPLRPGVVPGSAGASDRVISHEACQAVADQIRLEEGRRGVVCASAILNGHGAKKGAEEICELDPAEVADRYERHYVIAYADWLDRLGVDACQFDDVT